MLVCRSSESKTQTILQQRQQQQEILMKIDANEERSVAGNRQKRLVYTLFDRRIRIIINIHNILMKFN